MRFRSKLADQHLGAFFELCCYALLRQQGLPVTPEHIGDDSVGKPIDFLVQPHDALPFYLESTVAMDSNAASLSQRILQELR